MQYIYINGFCLTQTTNGVQRFATNILLELDKLISQYNNITIVCLIPQNIDRKFNNIQLKIIKSYFNFINNKQTLWEQIVLPFYCNNGILINLCNFAPLFKKNQFVVIHDVIPFRYPKTVGFLWGTFYRIMVRIFMNRVQYIATVSEFSAKELQQITNNRRKILVLGNSGEHIKQFEPNINLLDKFQVTANNYIFIPSSQSHMPHKNINIIYDIASQINQPIIITGNCSQQYDNIKYIGKVNDDELATLYKYASCILYPSLYEGFGIPILEALEFNNLIIASDIPVFKEIGNNAIIYCNTQNQMRLINCIVDTLQNQQQLKYELQTQMIKVREKYNWVKITKKIYYYIYNISEKV
jgi:glycosyltransferase involved in cell wall biosynthesis